MKTKGVEDLTPKEVSSFAGCIHVHDQLVGRVGRFRSSQEKQRVEDLSQAGSQFLCDLGGWGGGG